MNECEETLVTTNEVIYAGAYVITEKLNGKPKNYNNRRKHKKTVWKTKIVKEINEIRREVATLDELLRCVKVKSRTLNKMKKEICYEETGRLTTIKGNPKTENSTKNSKNS